MFLLLCLACAADSALDAPLVESVDPFIGTGGQGFGQGAASPAATVPCGMVKVGPDTASEGGAPGFAHASGYWWEDGYVVAFSHTRMHGTGAPDGGAIGVMPAPEETVDWHRYRAPLDHDREQAGPGWYSVELPGRALVELTATRRVAAHRITWAGGGGGWLVVDLAHTAADHEVGQSWLEVDQASGELRGFVEMEGDLSSRYGGQDTWFVARPSRPWTEAGTWVDGERVGGAGSVSGSGVAATLRFDGELELLVGISPVSIAGARQNLRVEASGRSFDELRDAATASWEEALGRFEVAGGSAEQREIMATALYHSLQMPTLYTDVDGLYRGLDGVARQAAGWTYYTDFSLWDTYRTLHPLVLLAWPELAADYARSLADMGARLGHFPRWPQGSGDGRSMLGNSAEVVLARSFLEGVDDFSVERSFATAKVQAEYPEAAGARDDLEAELEHGYVPADAAGGSVSETLEYAIDDHAIAMWAEAMGDRDAAASFAERSLWYANVFDPETGFMRGRNGDGSWVELEETSWSDPYAEGNAWQYTWLVPHDAAGLADAFGGREALFEKLDTFFERSLTEADTFMPDTYYWHGNEPDLHAAFLYSQLGRPSDGSRWASWIRDTRYGTGPDGLDGNDDGGTLSSWYVFVAMGLYPVNATDRYVLLAPVFDRVTIHRPDGDLSIEAAGSGDYLAGAWLDGEALDLPIVEHERLVGGHHLELLRSEEPSGWGTW